MSIKDLLLKIKPFYHFILSIVIALIFFGLGWFASLEQHKTPIKIEYPNSEESGTVIASITDKNNSAPEVLQSSGAVIGSKSGKKYYFPWCSTVKRIKPENQVPFASIEEAKKAGFTPGGNCKGLN